MVAPATPQFTITGTIVDPKGVGQPGVITFALQNLQAEIPLTQYYGMVPTLVNTVVASDGTFSQTLYANSATLLPPNTFYTADFVSTKGTRITGFSC